MLADQIAPEVRQALQEVVMLIPNLVKLLYRLIDDKRIPAVEKLILAGTAAYVISPVDLIPDFIPFLGQLDDIVLIALALKRLFNVAGPEVLQEHWDGRQDVLQMVDRVLDLSRLALPERIYQRLVHKVDKDFIDVQYTTRDEQPEEPK